MTFLGTDATPELTSAYTDNNGMDGNVFNFANFKKNTIDASFLLHFWDWDSYQALKHNLYALLGNQVVRIRTDAQPNFVEYVRTPKFEIKPIGDGSPDAKFTIQFENPSGYKYNLNTTDQLADIWDDYPLGYNIGIQEAADYTFTTSSFQICNIGDVKIDPYYKNHDMQIIIHFKGNSLTVTNSSNGDSWTYNTAATKSDTIILDGINTFRNGASDSKSTDFGNISLERGFNNIYVSGSSDFDITFSFRGLYLD